MTDQDFLAAVLADGEWHSHADILGASFRERGHGLTVHSRAADLRKRGHEIACRTEHDEQTKRVVSFYRMLDAASTPPVSCGARPAALPVEAAASSVPSSSPDFLPPRVVLGGGDGDGTLSLFDDPVAA